MKRTNKKQNIKKRTQKNHSFSLKKGGTSEELHIFLENNKYLLYKYIQTHDDKKIIKVFELLKKLKISNDKQDSKDIADSLFPLLKETTPYKRNDENKKMFQEFYEKILAYISEPNHDKITEFIHEIKKLSPDKFTRASTTLHR